MPKLSHLDSQGEAHMVDVGGKAISRREAVAESRVQLSAECFKLLIEGQNKKGDVFAVARIAGIQAAKKCSDLIPLCHPLMLSKIDIELSADATQHCIYIRAMCRLDGKTGVEMEALTGASVAALTVYDMCKAVDKGIVIGPTQLVSKTGGRSGNWQRSGESDAS